MLIVVVSNKEWHRQYIGELSARTGSEVVYIDNKSEVNYQRFAAMQPDWVFFRIGLTLYRLMCMRIFAVLFST